MIRKRRRKRRLHLQDKQRTQLSIVLVGAALAAILAASIPSSCSNPLRPLQDENLQEQLEDLAQEAGGRGR